MSAQKKPRKLIDTNNTVTAKITVNPPQTK